MKIINDHLLRNPAVPKQSALIRQQFYVLTIICGTQLNHRFPFPFSQFLKLCGAGGSVVNDVGDDEIGLVYHPLIAVADRKALRRGLDALREDGVGVVRQPIFVLLLRHIREDDVISDRVLG